MQLGYYYKSEPFSLFMLRAIFSTMTYFVYSQLFICQIRKFHFFMYIRKIIFLKFLFAHLPLKIIPINETRDGLRSQKVLFRKKCIIAYKINLYCILTYNYINLSTLPKNTFTSGTESSICLIPPQPAY